MIYRRITSREEFERTVELGKTPESKYLEFKGGYGWRGANKDAQAIELCRDAAQLANTDGGVLLIGVTEAEAANGRTARPRRRQRASWWWHGTNCDWADPGSNSEGEWTMITISLLNIAVTITVGDPWEFGAQCGVGPFPGRVVEERPDAVAVVLDVPLSYEGKRLASVVIRPWHVGDQVAALGDGQEVMANCLFTDNESVSLTQGDKTGMAATGSVRAK